MDFDVHLFKNNMLIFGSVLLFQQFQSPGASPTTAESMTDLIPLERILPPKLHICHPENIGKPLVAECFVHDVSPRLFGLYAWLCWNSFAKSRFKAVRSPASLADAARS